MTSSGAGGASVGVIWMATPRSAVATTTAGPSTREAAGAVDADCGTSPVGVGTAVVVGSGASTAYTGGARLRSTIAGRSSACSDAQATNTTIAQTATTLMPRPTPA